MSDTESRILSLIREHFGQWDGRTASEIVDAALSLDSRLDAKLIADLRLDSLDLVELVMATEDEFRIEITDDEAEPFVGDTGQAGRTVRDWCAFVDGKLAGVVA